MAQPGMMATLAERKTELLEVAAWLMVLAVAVVLRTWRLGEFEIIGDEFVQLTMWDPTHPPLTLYTVKLPGIFTSNLWIVRGWISVFGVLGVIAVGMYVRRCTGRPQAGWMAAGLVAVNLFDVQLGQVPKGYIFIILTTTLAAQALLATLQGSRDAFRLYCALAVLSAWYETLSVVVIAADAIWVLSATVRRRALLRVFRPRPVLVALAVTLPIAYRTLEAGREFARQPSMPIDVLFQHVGQVFLGVPGPVSFAVALALPLAGIVVTQGSAQRTPDAARIVFAILALAALRSAGIHIEGRHLSILFASWVSLVVRFLVSIPRPLGVAAWLTIVGTNLLPLHGFMYEEPVNMNDYYDYYQRQAFDRPYSVGRELARTGPPTRVFLVGRGIGSQLQRLAAGVAGSYLFEAEAPFTTDEWGRKTVAIHGTQITEVRPSEVTLRPEELRMPRTVVYSPEPLNSAMRTMLETTCRESPMPYVFSERSSFWICGSGATPPRSEATAPAPE